ncbi:cobalt-precorrin 5A acetaldehyde-lyase [Kineothrix alysoides]|uniref:Cobalt-precorrin 5A acetaldehyde-lyase n=2 Tax=Kineothrix alysoides TaxID=1469948 RepID=A0A4R1QU48_9FIRM|nr:cobalt-precorrin 5A acetaldehyde-lyase [Kineothrix alysoides]
MHRILKQNFEGEEVERKSVSIISFTERGMKLSEELKDRTKESIHASLYTKWGKYPEDNHRSQSSLPLPPCLHENKYAGKEAEVTFCEESLFAWTRNRFFYKQPIIFIGACGIAVRAIAPLVRDKLQDIPVLVVDEAGRFVIPLLSGHFGGANELAEEIAGIVGMSAVITTATDVNQLFAVDVFARHNHLAICNREGIKEISAAILAKEKVTFAIDGIYEGRLPEGLTFAKPEERHVSIFLSPYEKEERTAMLYLVPRVFVIGIGCRRGKTAAEIEAEIDKYLRQARIRIEAVSGIASIDVKKDEKGLCELSEKYGWNFQTFSKEELESVPGNYKASSFVKSMVGVDNVCERAAMAACKEDAGLVLGKQAQNGVTVAIAVRKWSVSFDEA